MFTANHPLIFCTLQRALICLPSFEDRQLFDGWDAGCLDTSMGRLNLPGGLCFALAACT
jgi:hypothetical protein